MRRPLSSVTAVLILMGASVAGAAEPLVHEGVVAGPVDKVWAAFTTKEGQEAWMVAHSEVDLRIDGLMRTHYSPEGKLGDAGTIENRILCYEPQRLFAIQVARTPEKFPFPNAVKSMWTVIHFEPETEATTRVRIVGLGFGDDEESKKMREFFDHGNAYTLKKLQEHFAPPAPGTP